jgi:hypothetical protein
MSLSSSPYETGKRNVSRNVIETLAKSAIRNGQTIGDLAESQIVMDVIGELNTLVDVKHFDALRSRIDALRVEQKLNDLVHITAAIRRGDMVYVTYVDPQETNSFRVAHPNGNTYKVEVTQL